MLLVIGDRRETLVFLSFFLRQMFDLPGQLDVLLPHYFQGVRIHQDCPLVLDSAAGSYHQVLSGVEGQVVGVIDRQRRGHLCDRQRIKRHLHDPALLYVPIIQRQISESLGRTRSLQGVITI